MATRGAPTDRPEPVISVAVWLERERRRGCPGASMPCPRDRSRALDDPAVHTGRLRQRCPGAPDRARVRCERGVMDERETWTTEEFGTSHKGAVGVLLADGTAPKPVFFDTGSSGAGR